MSRCKQQSCYIITCGSRVDVTKLGIKLGDGRRNERTHKLTKILLGSTGLRPLWGRNPKNKEKRDNDRDIKHSNDLVAENFPLSGCVKSGQDLGTQLVAVTGSTVMLVLALYSQKTLLSASFRLQVNCADITSPS